VCTPTASMTTPSPSPCSVELSELPQCFGTGSERQTARRRGASYISRLSMGLLRVRNGIPPRVRSPDTGAFEDRAPASREAS